MRYWTVLLGLFCCLFAAPLRAQDRPLRLATLEYPPYISDTAQGAQGLTVDIVNAVFARLGQAIRIEFYPVARGQQRLLNGEADAFFSIKKTPERERLMLFTQKPVLSQDYLFFVRKDSRWRFDGRFDSLADARVGVVTATSYGSRFDSAAQSGAFTTLDSASSHLANFRKLLAGRVDAVICSRLVGLHYLAQLNGLGEVEARGPVVETTLSYLVFSRAKDHSVLARQFDQALESIERDGTLERLQNAYLPPPSARGGR